LHKYAGKTSNCSPLCGDGRLVGSEIDPGRCDDGNLIPSDGCSTICVVNIGYTCTGTPSICTPNCGDGILLGI
jgi:cysteine-rich repeat protein